MGWESARLPEDHRAAREPRGGTALNAWPVASGGKALWCVTTDRPEAATAALSRLIDDGGLRERLGRSARAWAEQHLSCATLAARTQALYERLAGR